MQLSPDSIIYFSIGPFAINATIVLTWVVMFLLVLGAWLATHSLSTETPTAPTRWQSALEANVTFLHDETRAITEQDPRPYLPFAGSLFLFIAMSNVVGIVPGIRSPLGSLSLTTALALCVFVAVPVYGIQKKGLVGYLRNYIQPNVIMLPFNLISDFSRTLSLSVRLFGNIMSGQILVAIMLSLIPLFVPAFLELFGLVIGFIQAYIFTVLALVYIGGATSDL